MQCGAVWWTAFLPEWRELRKHIYHKIAHFFLSKRIWRLSNESDRMLVVLFAVFVVVLISLDRLRYIFSLFSLIFLIFLLSLLFLLFLHLKLFLNFLSSVLKGFPKTHHT